MAARARRTGPPRCLRAGGGHAARRGLGGDGLAFRRSCLVLACAAAACGSFWRREGAGAAASSSFAVWPKADPGGRSVFSRFNLQLLPGTAAEVGRTPLVIRAAARKSPPAPARGPRTSARKIQEEAEDAEVIEDKVEKDEEEEEAEDDEEGKSDEEPADVDDEDWESPRPPRKRVRRIQDEEILPPGTKYQGGRRGMQFFVGDMVEVLRDGKLMPARMARIPTDERPMDGAFMVKWDDNAEEWKCSYKDLNKPRPPINETLPSWIEDWWPAEPPMFLKKELEKDWLWVSNLRPGGTKQKPGEPGVMGGAGGGMVPEPWEDGPYAWGKDDAYKPGPEIENLNVNCTSLSTVMKKLHEGEIGSSA